MSGITVTLSSAGATSVNLSPTPTTYDNRNSVNILDFGADATGATDSTTAINAALAVQQASSDRYYLDLPGGTFLYSGTGITGTKPFCLRGAGGNPLAPRTILQSTADNSPIILFAAGHQAVEDVYLTYSTYRTAAKTAAACIQFANGSYFCRVRNVLCDNGAYGIYNPSGATSWQNFIENFWCRGFSISGIQQITGGTTWTWQHIYVQNTTGPSVSTATIQSIVRAAAALTITVNTAPPNLVANCFFSITGVTPATYSVMLVAKTVVGNTITADLAADPGVDPVLGTSPTLSFAAQVSSDSPVILAGNVNTFHGLDVEHCLTDDTILMDLRGECVEITDLHLEAVYGSRTTLNWISSVCRSLNVGTLNAINSGFRAGQTGYSLYNYDTSRNFRVSLMTTRDIAHTGTTWNLGRVAAGASNPLLGALANQGTVRANADGTPDSYANVNMYSTEAFAP